MGGLKVNLDLSTIFNVIQKTTEAIIQLAMLKLMPNRLKK